MKALDTPVLVAILRGERRARAKLKEWRGLELATTEWNLLELEALARADPSPGRERRLAAVAKLRGCLTILPIDSRATKAASIHFAEKVPQGREFAVWAMYGAAEAAGGEEWVTTPRFAIRPKRSRVRVGLLALTHAKDSK